MILTTLLTMVIILIMMLWIDLFLYFCFSIFRLFWFEIWTMLVGYGNFYRLCLIYDGDVYDKHSIMMLVMMMKITSYIKKHITIVAVVVMYYLYIIITTVIINIYIYNTLITVICYVRKVQRVDDHSWCAHVRKKFPHNFCVIKVEFLCFNCKCNTKQVDWLND
jgi:hypothetical protein